MAYSDYGGYAYRNGVRVVERSDCVLCPEEMMSTPGAWPGWQMLAQNPSAGKQKLKTCEMVHVLLGDGPIMVGLYKQMQQFAWKSMDKLDLSKFLKKPTYIDRHISGKYFGQQRELKFSIDRHDLTIWLIEEDNHYQYAELRQPDGNIWHGFSGYGVGAGLEDAGYGYPGYEYSTDDCIDRLWDLFEKPKENER